MSWNQPNQMGGPSDMRHLFLADQNLYTALGYISPAPQQLGERPLAGGSADLRVPSSSQPPRPQNSQYVGWGGQAIPDNGGFRVPWFGRSKGKPSHQRARTPPVTEGRSDSHGYGNGSGNFASPYVNREDALSVEDAVKLIQRLSRQESLPDKIFRSLYHFDSRALSLLLKDLSKAGLDYRAVELFDFLRGLGERHVLRHLCDVYTYTAMISVCIYQQNVDRAMELLNDMKARNIERNVHTYTALMNVCIKCGKLTMALDIYHSMRSALCVPNVVTYNTLIDVYGKLGQWEKAVQVLTLMKNEGVPPVLRTYNTLVIACNMCNQPRECLAVYNEMLSKGFTPNSTTYNALISAYGKLGQLDKVLEVYRDMVWKGLERSVITYSSLISACEKAGRWDTALELFDEMQREGCKPNTVTFNSLITACAQGAQWEKAREVFEQMQSQGCVPDVVTYTALISALERGGQWQLALQAFQQMCVQGCRPDAIVYNAIIDALWETGITWAQSKALLLFKTAQRQGHFQQAPLERSGPRAELNLHALTAGVAMLSLYSWLKDIRQKVALDGDSGLPSSLAIVTDAGHASREQGNFIVKEAVAATMTFWGAPFRIIQDSSYAGVLEASGAQVAKWVQSKTFNAQMSSLFPITDSAKGMDPVFTPDDVDSQREFQVKSFCGDAFKIVQDFETTHGLALQVMGLDYLQQRSGLVSQLLDFGGKLGLKDEVVHDAVLLMDRTISSTGQADVAVLPLLAAAALRLSCKQSDCPVEDDQFESVTELSLSQVQDVQWNMCNLLDQDTAAISSLRCLKIYLERMGYRYLDKAGIYGIAGLPIMLVVESLFETALLNCRPSVVAAALLYAERRQRGAVPFWPSTLAKMTGYEDLTSPELAVAVRTAQKLCRKLLYTQIYRVQATCLHGDTPGTAPGGMPGTDLPAAEDLFPTLGHMEPGLVQGLAPGSSAPLTADSPDLLANALHMLSFSQPQHMGGDSARGPQAEQ